MIPTVVCSDHQQSQCEICFKWACICCGLPNPCPCPTQVPHSCRALRGADWVEVERDVDTYIKALKDIDPGADDESYGRLHDHLCPMIYEMRRSRE